MLIDVVLMSIPVTLTLFLSTITIVLWSIKAHFAIQFPSLS